MALTKAQGKFSQAIDDGADATAITIDSSERVGVGTTSPSTVVDIEGAWVNNQGLLAINATSGTYSGLSLQYSGNANGYLWWNNSTSKVDLYSGGEVGLHSNGTERIRIDSSGNVGIGTTSISAKLHVDTSGIGFITNGDMVLNGTSVNDVSMLSIYQHTSKNGITWRAPNTNAKMACQFENSSGSRVGYIQYTSSTVTYSPSSDARLKENIRDYDNALADVMKLQPRKYSWIADGAEDSGFIAQELLEIPEFAHRASNGEEGENAMYGVDYMKFVAVLTGAIQEQQTIIEDLQTRLSALEAN